MTSTSLGDTGGVGMGVASGMIMGPTHNPVGSFTEPPCALNGSRRGYLS